jgi:hypothetical protein
MSEVFDVQVFDARLSCPQCRRFVREEQVVHEDYFDPRAYYGVGTRSTTTCGRCGPVDGYALTYLTREPKP